MTNKVIRDFIYIDVDRLYSLYSQVFEGVAAQILTSITKEGTNRDSQKGVFGTGKGTEELVTEASQETSNKLLHDFLYNELEDGISGAITVTDGVTPENYWEKLKDSFLVKVAGTAEVFDYDRLIYDTQNIHLVAKDIAYVAKSSEAISAEAFLSNHVQELQANISRLNTNDKRNRTALNAELREAKKNLGLLQDREGLKQVLAANMGLDFQPDFLKSVADTFRFFNGDGFEVSIIPASGMDGVAYRGILDKQHLRVQPEYLRLLYSGTVTNSWTMVGEITKFPLPDEQSNIPLLESTDAVEAVEQADGMRDQIRKVIMGLSGIETVFNKSSRTEVRVRPLAIYREVIVPVSEKSSVV